MPLEGQAKFFIPQDISRALQWNSFAAFSGSMLFQHNSSLSKHCDPKLIWKHILGQNLQVGNN